MDLEQTENKVEPTEVSEKESKGEVSPVEGEVSGEPDEETNRILAEARQKWMESEDFHKAIQSEKDKSIAKEMQPLREEIARLHRESEEAKLVSQENAERARLGETDELAELHRVRRHVYGLANQYNESIRKAEAYELSVKDGVDFNELIKLNTPEEMRARSNQLKEESIQTKIRKLEEQLATAKKAPQIIDTSQPSMAGSPDLDKMTAKQLIQHGLNKERKK